MMGGNDQQKPSREEEEVLKEVLKALKQIKHGYIQLVVQDSRVIQIDKTEKLRFTPTRMVRTDQM